MHSPIIYVSMDADKLCDLTKKDERQQFIDQYFLSYMDEEFQNYVPKADSWTLNVQDSDDNEQNEWDGYKWDVLDAVKSEMRAMLGKDKLLTKVKNGVYKLTLTPEDANDRYRTLINKIQDAAEHLGTVVDGAAKDMKLAIGQERYQLADHFESPMKVLAADGNDMGVITLSDLVDQAMYSGKEVDVYIYTLINGDYHY